MIKSAKFSDCRTWRYSLMRVWDEKLPLCQFIGLNPSTADEEQDDPTVRRCINFARHWGFGGLIMSNIFAFRATDPRDMKAFPEPVGVLNDLFLWWDHERAGCTVAAWGAHGAYLDRGEEVAKHLHYRMMHLGKTKDGHPRHPLYLKRTEQRRKWDEE